MFARKDVIVRNVLISHGPMVKSGVGDWAKKYMKANAGLRGLGDTSS